jgi:hypothetical protein
MSKQRAITAVVSILLMIGIGIFLQGSKIEWNAGMAYSFHALLAAYFFLVLVSNQYYEEDVFARSERAVSAFLFSYILLIQMTYAPIARYIFGSLVTKTFFMSDILALVLFLFFVFLFGTTFLVVNRFSRFGISGNWFFFNSSPAFFILRSLLPAAVLASIYIFLLRPFIIIMV